MTRLLTFLFAISFCLAGTSQNLNDYSYVIVPNRFEFQSESNQYKLNEMAKYYFEKNGFNAFMNNQSPNAPRCDGLYADVDQMRLIFGTGFEVVLRDCNNIEIYRSDVGKSKYKKFEKAYQDALRKSFKSFESLGVKQKDVEFYSDQESVGKYVKTETVQLSDETNRGLLDSIEDEENQRGLKLPSKTYTAYKSQGDYFLLKKTGEGYSLYKETNEVGDGLLFLGKIVILDSIIKYMDGKGNVSDASFDGDGTLTISSATSQNVYKRSEN